MACRVFFKGRHFIQPFSKRDTGTWIEVKGFIRRLLSDDDDGSRHQRFIIDIGNRITLLVAHNIDLAKRVPVGMGTFGGCSNGMTLAALCTGRITTRWVSKTEAMCATDGETIDEQVKNHKKKAAHRAAFFLNIYR